MPSAFVTDYLAHRAAVDARTGGESAEWPEIAQALADMYLEELGNAPLSPRLRYAFPFQLRRPNGEWPNLVVVYKGAVQERGQSDSVWRRFWYRFDVLLLCGPYPGDEARMQELGGPYQDPLVRVLDHHQDLGGRCRAIRLRTDPITWSTLLRRYYGLNVPIEVFAQQRVDHRQ